MRGRWAIARPLTAALQRAIGRGARNQAWARCQADNDACFVRSVRQGKVMLGGTHMPARQGVFSMVLAWAIQLFTGKPRLRPLMRSGRLRPPARQRAPRPTPTGSCSRPGGR